MHSRTEIIRNQKVFSYEIKKWLKQDFVNSKKELRDIETEDIYILNEIISLENKFKNINVNKDINKLFINEKNIYPKFYAWWNEEMETVEINLYENK